MSAERFPEIKALYDWSTNFEWVSSPFAVFLNLTGYSYSEWGAGIVMEEFPALGYMELDYIADAMKEYAKYGAQDTYAYITDLLDEDRSEESNG